MNKIMISMLMFSWSLAAVAHDGTINIEGTILDKSCTVVQNDLSVTLGNIASKQLEQVGDVSLPVAFNVDLKDCSSATTGVELTFTGTSNTTNPDLLALSGDEGSASGVGIAIKDDQSTLIPLNNASRLYPIDPTQSENHLVFYAQYMATSQSVTAGEANATATFMLTYP